MNLPFLFWNWKMDTHTQHQHQHQPEAQAETNLDHPHAEHVPEEHSSHAAHQENVRMDMSSHEGDLIHSEEHASHADHTGHENLFRQRFWVSLLLSIPVLLYTSMLQMWFGYAMPAFFGSQWVTPLFAVIVFVYGGLPFIQMAVPEIRNRQPGMMTLISLAISVSFIYSLAAQFVNLGEGFFWELVTLIDIMLLGHWIEMRSVRQASGALNILAKLMPDTAEHVMPDGSIHTMPASSLKTGSLVLLRPGASVPADGIVEDGESDVNESMITGESLPVKKILGAKVIAGTINGNGSLRVRVSAVGEQTALAGIMRLVREAQQSKSRTQILADKAAGWLFYFSIGIALLTSILWTFSQGFNLFTLQPLVA